MTGQGQLYSLSRKEGWRRYVEAPARQRPDQLPPGQLKRLGCAAREDYDEARHDWHANFGILRTVRAENLVRVIRPGDIR
jgi:hypothetical protein